MRLADAAGGMPALVGGHPTLDVGIVERRARAGTEPCLTSVSTAFEQNTARPHPDGNSGDQLFGLVPKMKMASPVSLRTTEP